MPGGRRAASAVAGLLVVSAVVTSCIVLRGRQGDSIRFPLAPHADLMDDCSQCHDGVIGADVDSNTRRALEASCLQCHEQKAEDCSFCHTDVDSAGVFPERERHLSFSHETHIARVQGDCERCHGGAAADLPAHPVSIPGHSECFSCHQMQQFYDRLECQNCHEQLFQYGLQPYENFSHGPDWLDRGHGAFVQDQDHANTCAQCHDQTFCTECHQGEAVFRLWERSPEKVSRTFLHPGDYVFRHMWDVRADAASCVRCHQPTFCNECHESRAITPRTASDDFRFHGAGVLVPGSPDYHGNAARRDIVSCAACHSQGTGGDCTTCHVSGGIGGNPHPPGFSSQLSKTGAQVCRICHAR